MPRIKNLKRFLTSRLNFDNISDYAEFKIIPKEKYERKDWQWAHTIGITFMKTEDGTLFKYKDYGDEVFRETEEREFNSLPGFINYIAEKWPSEHYVYYYPKIRYRPYRNYISLRDFLGFTIDEAEAWKIILARALNHLNGRKLIGIRILSKDTSIRCDECGERAVVQLIFDYHGQRYAVNYCKEHLIEEIGRLEEELRLRTDHILGRFRKLVGVGENE